MIYHDIPPHLLKIVDQLPTIACPVMKAGRGHTLSSTVTGGVWPDDITYDRMKKEKGVDFVPGGEIPSKVRTTARDFLRQNTWTGNIPIEVQKVSPVCFGIWVAGIERLTQQMPIA